MALTQAKTTERPLPPGRMGLPFIGRPLPLLDMQQMMALYEKHGPIFKTRLLGRNIAVFMGPEANRFLLSTGMKHFSWQGGWPPTFRELLGESLFVQDGEEHRLKRRLIAPAFHRQSLHNYLTTMEAITLRYLDRWERMGQFPWLGQYKQLTFEIASTLLTGSEPGPMTEHLSRLFVQLTKGFISLPLRWRWTPYGRALHARDALLAHIEQAVEQRRDNPTNDALSLLVQTRDEEGRGLTMDELKAQTLLMLFAGHETSASMLTSLVMLLAQHPAAWQRARAEQEAIGIAGPLQMEHFRQMPYLDQVLKEVERLHPPVPAGFRSVVQDLEFNGYRVPEGWIAFYPINVTHRDPAIYTNPDHFDPDRFGPERSENDVPYSLVGFGGGPRLCVGYAFAQLEMKVAASYLLRHYTWEIKTGQSLKMVYNPTLYPESGLQVNFRRRS